MTVVVVTRDLMDGGRFRSALPTVEVVREPSAEAIEDASIVIVDLAGGFDLDVIVGFGIPVVAYGAHVDTEALDGAIAAGCVEAVPRSKIFRRAAELLD